MLCFSLLEPSVPCGLYLLLGSALAYQLGSTTTPDTVRIKRREVCAALLLILSASVGKAAVLASGRMDTGRLGDSSYRGSWQLWGFCFSADPAGSWSMDTPSSFRAEVAVAVASLLYLLHLRLTRRALEGRGLTVTRTLVRRILIPSGRGMLGAGRLQGARGTSPSGRRPTSRPTYLSRAEAHGLAPSQRGAGRRPSSNASALFDGAHGRAVSRAGNVLDTSVSQSRADAQAVGARGTRGRYREIRETLLECVIGHHYFGQACTALFASLLLVCVLDIAAFQSLVQLALSLYLLYLLTAWLRLGKVSYRELLGRSIYRTSFAVQMTLAVQTLLMFVLKLPGVMGPVESQDPPLGTRILVALGLLYELPAAGEPHRPGISFIDKNGRLLHLLLCSVAVPLASLIRASVDSLESGGSNSRRYTAEQNEVQLVEARSDNLIARGTSNVLQATNARAEVLIRLNATSAVSNRG
jgi:hypothetical protein